MSDPYTGHTYPWEMWEDRYRENEPCYMVRCPDLGGCMTHGDTPEEALESLKELAPFYLACLREWGIPVPPPSPPRQQQPQPQAWARLNGEVVRLEVVWEGAQQ